MLIIFGLIFIADYTSVVVINPFIFLLRKLYAVLKWDNINGSKPVANKNTFWTVWAFFSGSIISLIG